MDLEVEDIVQDLMVSRYLALAAITLYFYEWFLVFDEEVELLGTLRLSMGKILYYFTRIVTPFGLSLVVFQILDIRSDLSDEVCLAFFWISTILEIISIFASYWLLTPRLIALYKTKPIIVYLLYISLFTAYFTSLGFLIHNLLTNTVAYAPSINLCVPLGRMSSLQGVFEAPLCFEVLLFGFTVWHAWKDYLGLRESGPHVRMPPLLKVLYRDGLLFFCAKVALSIWNIITYATRPISEMYMGLYIMWSLVTVLTCRIYLNIVRETRRHPISTLDTHHPTSSHSSTIPTFDYSRTSDGSDAVYIDGQSSATTGPVHSRPPWGNDSQWESYSMDDR